jgi:hypothetical protein
MTTMPIGEQDLEQLLERSKAIRAEFERLYGTQTLEGPTFEELVGKLEGVRAELEAHQRAVDLADLRKRVESEFPADHVDGVMQAMEQAYDDLAKAYDDLAKLRVKGPVGMLETIAHALNPRGLTLGPDALAVGMMFAEKVRNKILARYGGGIDDVSRPSMSVMSPEAIDEALDAELDADPADHAFERGGIDVGGMNGEDDEF